MRLFGKKDWNYHGFNKKTKSFYDENGYDIRGYDKKGYDKKGYDLHGFDIKGIHKKTKIKFDEDGYDKQRFDADGYGKDGFDRDGYNVKGYDRNGILKPKEKKHVKRLIEDTKQKKNQNNGDRYNPSKHISDAMIANWQRKNPPDQSGPSSIYFVTWSWAFSAEVIKIGGSSNSELGELTEKGYDLYLSLLHVIGKNTVCGAPKKKSKLVVSYGILHQFELVTHDRIEREYFLSSKGAALLQVLALALSNNSTPRIG